ncbi:hypothetical protein BDZ89DRAFT_1150963 [Hymenopellis radicata]|nr:hypothetical protein BDZ89DRAFT_1150963 [Hymenopellis radicata]
MPSPPHQYGAHSQYLLGRSTVHEISYAPDVHSVLAISSLYPPVCLEETTPDKDEKRRNEEQQAATGRKSWKNLRDKEEAVWSPALEAALIEEGEEAVPMRNRIISNHIHQTTGKYRTPKQVGSRLQQLRDTCKLQELRLLIAPPSDDEGDTDVCSSSSPSLPPPLVQLQIPGAQSGMHESPDIALQALPSVAHADIFARVDLELDTSNGMLRNTIALAGYRKDAPLYTVINLAPRPFDYSPGCTCVDLLSFDSTVQFWSPFPVHTETVFSVFIETLSQPIHSELTTMLPLKLRRDERADIKQYRVLQCITPQWYPCIDTLSPINICYCFRQIPTAAPVPNFIGSGGGVSSEWEAQKWQRVVPSHEQVSTQSSYSSLAGWSGQPQEDMMPAVGSSYRRISGPPAQFREDALKCQDGINYDFLAQPAQNYDYLVL